MQVILVRNEYNKSTAMSYALINTLKSHPYHQQAFKSITIHIPLLNSIHAKYTQLFSFVLTSHFASSFQSLIKSTVCSFIYISFSQKITSLHIFIGIFLTSHSQEYENIGALNAVVDNDTWKEKKPAELVTILYGINRFLGHTWYAFGPQLHVFRICTGAEKVILCFSFLIKWMHRFWNLQQPSASEQNLLI